MMPELKIGRPGARHEPLDKLITVSASSNYRNKTWELVTPTECSLRESAGTF